MQGRSRLDKYQSLQNNRFDSPSNSGFERPTSNQNSFGNTQNYNNFERPNNNYDTNEFDSLLKGNEDFLNSLDQDLTQIGRGTSDRFARNEANNFNAGGYNQQPQMNNYQQNPYAQTNSFNVPNQYGQPQQPYGYQQPQQGYVQPQYNQQPAQPQYNQQQGYPQPQYGQQSVQPQVAQPTYQQQVQPQVVQQPYQQPVAPQVTPVVPQTQPYEQPVAQPQVAQPTYQQPVQPQVQPYEQPVVQPQVIQTEQPIYQAQPVVQPQVVQPQVAQPQQVNPAEQPQVVQQTNTISPMDRLENASLPPYAPVNPVQPQQAVPLGVDQNVASIFSNTSQNVFAAPTEQPTPSTSIVFGDNYANTQQVEVQPQEEQPQQAPNIADDEDALDDIFASFEELAADETVTPSSEQSISPMPGNESLQNVLSEFDNLAATANTQQISTVQENTNSDNAFDYVNNILGSVDSLTASSTVETTQEDVQAAFNAEFNQAVNTPKDPFADLDASNTVATQPTPVAQPSNTAQQPVFYDDPLNIQTLSTELNQQRTINQKLIEQTQEMSLKMSEYENEINDTQSSMSKTSKVLNLVLTILILTLFVILFIIGFWFAQERGLI